MIFMFQTNVDFNTLTDNRRRKWLFAYCLIKTIRSNYIHSNDMWTKQWKIKILSLWSQQRQRRHIQIHWIAQSNEICHIWYVSNMEKRVQCDKNLSNNGLDKIIIKGNVTVLTEHAIGCETHNWILFHFLPKYYFPLDILSGVRFYRFVWCLQIKAIIKRYLRAEHTPILSQMNDAPFRSIVLEPAQITQTLYSISILVCFSRTMRSTFFALSLAWDSTCKMIIGLVYPYKNSSKLWLWEPQVANGKLRTNKQKWNVCLLLHQKLLWVSNDINWFRCFCYFSKEDGPISRCEQIILIQFRYDSEVVRIWFPAET